MAYFVTLSTQAGQLGAVLNVLRAGWLLGVGLTHTVWLTLATQTGDLR